MWWPLCRISMRRWATYRWFVRREFGQLSNLDTTLRSMIQSMQLHSTRNSDGVSAFAMLCIYPGRWLLLTRAPSSNTTVRPEFLLDPCPCSPMHCRRLTWMASVQVWQLMSFSCTHCWIEWRKIRWKGRESAHWNWHRPAMFCEWNEFKSIRIWSKWWWTNELYLTASPLYKYFPVATGKIPNPMFVENTTCTRALNHNELLSSELTSNRMNESVNGCDFFSLIICDVSQPVWNVNSANDIKPTVMIARRNVLPL